MDFTPLRAYDIVPETVGIYLRRKEDMASWLRHPQINKRSSGSIGFMIATPALRMCRSLSLPGE
jgi:hypothetical protein